jgi:peptidoglycan hydrolase-like protein with peptidoglycan-binding domain
MVGLRKVQDTPSPITFRGPELASPVLSISEADPLPRHADTVARPVGVPTTTAESNDSGVAGNARGAMKGTALERAQGLFAQADKPLVRDDQQAQPRADVRELQTGLNKWRAAHGLSPIKTNGMFGADTEKAVKDFQKATGLQPGVAGQADAGTRTRLAVENDPTFQNHSAADQTAIRKLMTSFGNDVAALDDLKNLATRSGFLGHVGIFGSKGFNRLDLKTQKEVVDRLQTFGTNPQHAHNLLNLITAPEFDKLSSKAITRLVNAQLKNPNNEKLSANFRDLANGVGFQTLGEPGRTRVVDALVRYGGDQVKTDNLKNVVSATEGVSTKASLHMLNVHLGRPEDAQIVSDFKRVSDRSDFRKLPEDKQLEILFEVTNTSPGGDIATDNILNLHLDPRFQNLSFDARDEVLRSLSYSNYDIRLDQTKMDNLLTLAEAPGFSKLDDNAQRFLLDTLAARPDNTALATALRDLANDGAFQADRRNMYKNVEKVDRSIP